MNTLSKMRHFVLILALALAANSIAQDATNQTSTVANDGKSRESNIKRQLARTGGFLARPGSMKGSVVFIDTQSQVDVSKSFNDVFGYLKRMMPIKLELIKSEKGSATALKDKAKADFAVIFVDDKDSPSMTIYPEDSTAIVNFSKYSRALKLPQDKELLETRCAKGALKAFILLCGGGGSRYPGHVAAMRTPEQLDLAHDKVPHDILEGMKRYLESAGVTPLRQTHYRKACQEGWAPQPTNDIQKAIWDEVHTPPTKPLKITYDKAAQKPVVK